MHKAFAILLLVSGSLAFAQQFPNPSSNSPIFNYSLVPPTAWKQGLNMDFFKLEDFKENTWSLSQSLRAAYGQRIKQPSNMPIFVPEGKFFIELFKPDENIDYKLRIFEME